MFKKKAQDKNGITTPERIDRLYRSLILYRIPKSAIRWCEKTPRNVHELDQIESYFKGNFRFIHLVRDGRDVILSKHPTSREKYWVSPERWMNDVSAGLAAREHPNVLTVKYEDLIQDFEKSVREICTFLNLELSKEMLDWHAHATVTRNNALYSKIQQINTSSIGKWKGDKNKERVEELTLIPEAKALLLTFGYS